MNPGAVRDQTIWSAGTPEAAELALKLLRDAGLHPSLVARFPCTSGRAPSPTRFSIKVPASEAAAARQLLDGHHGTATLS